MFARSVSMNGPSHPESGPIALDAPERGPREEPKRAEKANEPAGGNRTQARDPQPQCTRRGPRDQGTAFLFSPARTGPGTSLPGPWLLRLAQQHARGAFPCNFRSLIRNPTNGHFLFIRRSFPTYSTVKEVFSPGEL